MNYELIEQNTPNPFPNSIFDMQDGQAAVAQDGDLYLRVELTIINITRNTCTRREHHRNHAVRLVPSNSKITITTK